MLEAQRERADRVRAMLLGEAEHGAGVDAAAQIAANRHVGAEPNAHGVVEHCTKALDVFGVAQYLAVVTCDRVLDVPVLRQ